MLKIWVWGHFGNESLGRQIFTGAFAGGRTHTGGTGFGRSTGARLLRAEDDALPYSARGTVPDFWLLLS